MGWTLRRLLGDWNGDRGIKAITAAELMAAINSSRPPVLIDIRSPEQYAAGHLPGAINVPRERLADAAPMPELERPVVVY
jgi:phage shock protein E